MNTSVCSNVHHGRSITHVYCRVTMFISIVIPVLQKSHSCCTCSGLWLWTHFCHRRGSLQRVDSVTRNSSFPLRQWFCRYWIYISGKKKYCTGLIHQGVKWTSSVIHVQAQCSHTVYRLSYTGSVHWSTLGHELAYVQPWPPLLWGHGDNISQQIEGFIWLWCH